MDFQKRHKIWAKQRLVMRLKSSNFGSKKSKELGKISYVVSDRKSSNFGSKKGMKFGQNRS